MLIEIWALMSHTAFLYGNANP